MLGNSGSPPPGGGGVEKVEPPGKLAARVDPVRWSVVLLGNRGSSLPCGGRAGLMMGPPSAVAPLGIPVRGASVAPGGWGVPPATEGRVSPMVEEVVAGEAERGALPVVE